MPDHYQFSIPIGAEDFAEKISFAKEHQFGIEVAAFASGPALADEHLRTRIERRLITALRGFPRRLSYHGAFIDLAVHSADPAIGAVARDRIERDLATASRLGCQLVVFHTGFNPLVPVQRYEDEFVERHAVFWPQLAEAWPELQIALENMWEPSPQIFERLLRAIHHPRLGLCLDVAHAHAYSDFGVETWLDRLRPRITHMHWNDNHGDTDSHLAIGEGNLPWKRIITSSRTLADRVSVVLELNSLRAIRQSQAYLTGLRASHAGPATNGPGRFNKRSNPRGFVRAT